MKLPLASLLFCIASATFGSAQSGPVAAAGSPPTLTHGNSISQLERKKIVDSYDYLPLVFEANRGQSDSQVRFLSRGPGYSLFLTPTQAVFTLRDGALQRPDSKSAVLRMQLVGANPQAQIEGQNALPGSSNYFRGSNPKNWQTNIPQYASVRYAKVYPGMDLVYYGNARELEYDFVLRPGADPDQIRLTFAGAARLHLDRGSLVVSSADRDFTLRKPHIYQDVNGERKEVGGRFVVKRGNQVGFKLDAYDRKRSLVIDPVFAYSTYVGGSREDDGAGIAVDSDGNAYITGQDRGSTDFPTANAFQPTFGGGFTDAFVTKINSDGSALVYSTYLGGSQNDSGRGIAVDSAGNAYITGQVDSGDFPIVNAIQPVFNGRGMAYVTKIGAAGTSLVYSTFLGGSGGEIGMHIAVDSAGSAYVTGYTQSTDFPTVNAIQPASGGGLDGFVTKINPGGTAFVYSTYLGGSGEDVPTAIAADSTGSAYVTGFTASTNFPTVNAFQPTLRSTRGNAFVSKINPAGSAFLYSTYLGGTGSDGGEDIAVDAEGNAYVVGDVTSTDFPVVNAIQPTLRGLIAAFVTKFSAAGNSLTYSTYLSGTSGGGGRAIAVDPSGNAYVTGITESADFPTVNALQPAYAGNRDSFVSVINPAGSAFLYSTYLGANKDDETMAIAVDSAGSAYVTGTSLSSSFPKTLNFQKRSLAFQKSMKGQGDPFVTKIAQFTLVKTSKKSLAFKAQGVGTTSQPLALTLTNSGTNTLAIHKIYVGGANAGDFAESDTCGVSVASGAGCTISVTFTPAAAGKRKGTLAVSNSDPASPLAIPLAGTGN